MSSKERNAPCWILWHTNRIGTAQCNPGVCASSTRQFCRHVLQVMRLLYTRANGYPLHYPIQGIRFFQTLQYLILDYTTLFGDLRPMVRSSGRAVVEADCHWSKELLSIIGKKILSKKMCCRQIFLLNPDGQNLLSLINRLIHYFINSLSESSFFNEWRWRI